MQHSTKSERSCGGRRPRAVLRWVFACMTTSGALFLLALVPAAGALTGATKPALTIGATPSSFATGLNPAKGSVDYEDLALEPLISVVANTHGKNIYGPGLATSWRYIGKGAKTFELTLRHDARFSDGTPVTAQAVKKWLDYFEASGSTKAELGPATITAIGKWTVRLKFKNPNPTADFALSGNVHFAEAGLVEAPSCVAAPATLDSKTCGAGEYMLDPSQTVAGDHYTFVPNPYYYDKSKVHWSKVIVKIIGSASSMLQALETGQIQAAQGDPTTATAAKNHHLRVLAIPDTLMSFTLDAGGTLSKPLGDVRVRQALNYAIDRKAIVRSIFNGWARPTSELETVDGVDPKLVNYYAYNPAKAKSLLAAAGYQNGFTIPSSNIVLSGDYPQAAAAVAQYWAAIGVKVTFTPVPVAAWFNTAFTNPAAVQIWGNSIEEPLWDQYGLVFKPGVSYWNRIAGGWKDAIITRDFNLGSQGVPGMWQAITDRLTTQAYFANLVVYDDLFYTASNIGGIAEPFLSNTTNLFLRKG